MHLWRSLPEGQLLAVLRWMGSRRQRPASDPRPAEAAPAAPETGEQKPVPTR